MGHMGFKSHTEHLRRYAERHKQLGLCISCSKPIVKGTTQCKYHLEKTKQRWEKYKLRRQNAKI